MCLNTLRHVTWSGFHTEKGRTFIHTKLLWSIFDTPSTKMSILYLSYNENANDENMQSKQEIVPTHYLSAEVEYIIRASVDALM